MTNANKSAAHGGQQPTPFTVRVMINPSLDRKDAEWTGKAVKAIQADRFPALNRLLEDRTRPVFSNLITVHTGGEEEADPANLLQLALIAKSYGCVEALSKHSHAADQFSEVDDAVTPWLASYEESPRVGNPVFELSIAALARGLFRAQERTEDYGVAGVYFEFPLASQAVARIHAEQTPKIGLASKPWQKRAYWLRQASRCNADNDSAGLADCLAKLAATHSLANQSKGDWATELHLLLMSCMGMKRLSCSGPIFYELAAIGDVNIAKAFIRHFLVQLTSHVPLAGLHLPAEEEDQLAGGIASIVLAFGSGSAARQTLLTLLVSKELLMLIGPVGAVAKKAALRVECEIEREELQASIASLPAAMVQRSSFSI